MDPDRRLRVRHNTTYRYDQPMPRSESRLKLRPLFDDRQFVLSHDLDIQIDGQPLGPGVPLIEYEDVFGNGSVRFEVNRPYQELSITATSVVGLRNEYPFAFADTPIRPQIPLVWVPRDKTVMAPFLTSVELPDTQLEELYEYAMGFVNKNNGDLMETLFNINLEFFHNYEYVPGFTTNQTTPFETYSSRKGVCQDFAQLFICMARLLNVPARYVCGYIFTGNTGVERAKSDASHAWLELYIPNVGWRGFDPTNGVLPDMGHVRVATGRFFRDTAPTDGTLYGDATETMSIDVEVAEVE